MILNVESVLMDAGFPEFHVKKELYWPKGKKATAWRRRRRGAGPAWPIAQRRVTFGPPRTVRAVGGSIPARGRHVGDGRAQRGRTWPSAVPRAG